MSRTLNRLSSAKVRAANAGLLCDGGGLYLRCTPNADGGASKSWVDRYGLSGKGHEMGCGSLDRVSMKRARELAAKYRELCARRIDPIEHRRTESQAHKGVVTFRESFETFFALKSQTLSTDKGRTNWQYSMET